MFLNPLRSRYRLLAPFISWFVLLDTLSLVLLMVVVLLIAALPAFAQSTTGGAPTGGLDLMQVLQTVGVIIATAIMGLFGTSPVTTFFVGLLKKIPQLGGISAPNLTLAVAGVLWLILSAARYFGYEIQFDNVLALLTTVLPPLAGFLGSLVGAPLVYEIAHANNVPILGYARDYGDRGTPAQRAQGVTPGPYAQPSPVGQSIRGDYTPPPRA